MAVAARFAALAAGDWGTLVEQYQADKEHDKWRGERRIRRRRGEGEEEQREQEEETKL